jgi:hypothetical protein
MLCVTLNMSVNVKLMFTGFTLFKKPQIFILESGFFIIQCAKHVRSLEYV